MWRAPTCSCTVFSNRSIRVIKSAAVSRTAGTSETVPDRRTGALYSGGSLCTFTNDRGYVNGRDGRRRCHVARRWSVEEQVCAATRFARRMKAGVQEAPLEPTRTL